MVQIRVWPEVRRALRTINQASPLAGLLPRCQATSEKDPTLLLER